MEAILWLIGMVVFLIAEAVTASVTTIWFAGGALAALIVCLAGGELWLQFVLFLVVSAILLVAFRPMIKKFISPQITATNVDSIIGCAGYVCIAIDNLNAQGQVTISGMPWTARSTTGDPIPESTLVRVDRIEGVKVFVTPIKIQVKNI